ncbi:flagellar basal body protein [Ramlibacter sp.]|uniref:flagellar basal body rod protein FlgB n=1 Tax=Ramlibacter sp. TaxID=1917967 RepID=UPI001837A36E|nr:flagellar basal body protein [Ramlibacter sp.]MBA2673204.1 flagellar basal body protein [Ramlibacter sp.]
MTEGLEALTTAALGLALDAASLRQRAIAANIANHATEGYVPVTVDFASQMEDARRALETRGTVDTASLSAVRVELQPMLDANGRPAKVQLDAQMADMAENAVQYQALVRALSRHFSILNSAATDGKR